MSRKFGIVLAIIAIVATMTLSEVDACKKCGFDFCSCQPMQHSSISCLAPPPIHIAPPPIHIAPPPQPTYSLCGSCGCNFPSPPMYLPKQHCPSCLKRKYLRLVDSCSYPSCSCQY